MSTFTTFTIVFLLKKNCVELISQNKTMSVLAFFCLQNKKKLFNFYVSIVT